MLTVSLGLHDYRAIFERIHTVSRVGAQSADSAGRAREGPGAAG